MSVSHGEDDPYEDEDEEEDYMDDGDDSDEF